MMPSAPSTMPGTRQPHKTRCTRRELLTTAVAGAIAAPLVVSSRVFGPVRPATGSMSPPWDWADAAAC